MKYSVGQYVELKEDSLFVYKGDIGKITKILADDMYYIDFGECVSTIYERQIKPLKKIPIEFGTMIIEKIENKVFEGVLIFKHGVDDREIKDKCTSPTGVCNKLMAYYKQDPLKYSKEHKDA